MKTKLLVVDDSYNFRSLLKKTLHQAEFEVIAEAKNGEIGFQQYKKTNPDIIITDINMPVMNGHELIKKIIQDNPNAKILAVLTKGSQKDIEFVFDIGASEYINKPFQTGFLFERLRKLKLLNNNSATTINTSKDDKPPSKNTNDQTPTQTGQEQEEFIFIPNEESKNETLINVKNNEDIFVYEEESTEFIKKQRQKGKKALDETEETIDVADDKEEKELAEDDAINIEIPKKPQRFSVSNTPNEDDIEIDDDCDINDLFYNDEKSSKKKVEKKSFIKKIKSIFKK